MREYEIWKGDKMIKIAFGYDFNDVVKRNPEYSGSEYVICGGWFID